MPDKSPFEQLREKFPDEQIGELPRGNTKLSYVGHAAVTDRLLAVDPEWTFEFELIEREGHVVAAVGSLTVLGVTRPEVGDVDRPSTYGQEAKLAVSDLIRRAAMRFGVALDLWSKEDLLGNGQEAGAGEPEVSGPPASPPAKTSPGRDESVVGKDAPGAGPDALPLPGDSRAEITRLVPIVFKGRPRVGNARLRGWLERAGVENVGELSDAEATRILAELTEGS